MDRRPPNILVFLPDQWRPDWLGFLGTVPVRTPHIDRLAARGVVFTRATTPSPLCAPARACLATGRDYVRCQVPDNDVDLPLELPTVYQGLRAAGYQVGSVGKLDLHKKALCWGIDGQLCLREWGFTHGLDSEGKLDAVKSYLSNGRVPQGPYMHYLAERGLADVHARDFRTRDQWLGVEPTPLPDDAYCDNWIGGNMMGVLGALDRECPWYLVANFTGPHNPQDVTPVMKELWKGVRFPAAVANTKQELALLNEIRQNYAAMCENIDRILGQAIAFLEDTGQLEDTLVVFSSDHGEMLGDHDRWGKSVWYHPSVGIPLVVAGPGVAGGRWSSALVQLHDLAPTWLEVAGAAPLPDSDAVSLVPLLRGPAPAPRPIVCAGLNDWFAVWDGRFKLVERNGTPAHLFDLEADPEELRDLIGERRFAREEERLVRTIERERTQR
jgi:arylsulfatase A-like enzyme